MTREDLIALCEDGVRPERVWSNRDSQGAHAKLGEAWALLKAGCEFHVHGEGDDPAPDEETIWLTIRSRGFQAFELGSEYMDEDLYYLPTRERLECVGERDWY